MRKKYDRKFSQNVCQSIEPESKLCKKVSVALTPENEERLWALIRHGKAKSYSSIVNLALDAYFKTCSEAVHDSYKRWKSSE